MCLILYKLDDSGKGNDSRVRYERVGGCGGILSQAMCMADSIKKLMEGGTRKESNIWNINKQNN